MVGLGVEAILCIFILSASRLRWEAVPGLQVITDLSTVQRYLLHKSLPFFPPNAESRRKKVLRAFIRVWH